MTELDNDIKDYVYISLLSKYLAANERTINDDNSDIFPRDWEIIGDSVKKAKILAEALDEKIHIEETRSYQELIETEKKDFII